MRMLFKNNDQPGTRTYGALIRKYGFAIRAKSELSSGFKAMLVFISLHFGRVGVNFIALGGRLNYSKCIIEGVNCFFRQVQSYSKQLSLYNYFKGPRFQNVNLNPNKLNIPIKDQFPFHPTAKSCNQFARKGLSIANNYNASIMVIL